MFFPYYQGVICCEEWWGSTLGELVPLISTWPELLSVSEFTKMPITVNGLDMRSFPARTFVEIWIKDGCNAADDAWTGKRKSPWLLCLIILTWCEILISQVLCFTVWLSFLFALILLPCWRDQPWSMVLKLNEAISHITRRYHRKVNEKQKSWMFNWSKWDRAYSCLQN